MKIEITRVTSWADVLNAARFTQGRDMFPRDFNPSDRFKRQIIRAEHSPLRCLMFNIDFYDIPYYVSVHLVRHVHAQPFVSSSRPDVNMENAPRAEQKKVDPVNMRLFLNAQEIINISKVRLCTKAEKETRIIWQAVISKLEMTEPILAHACWPSCIYRGICPEIKSCGYIKTKAYTEDYDEYINNLTVFADEH